jgi:arginine-tRNA-protein transferase
LATEHAALEVRVLLDVTPENLDAMLERGWRRFGACYFRPACASCQACVSLRVDVERFSPSKSQRRAERKNARLRRTVGSPSVDRDRLALYAKWHATRERIRGWSPNPVSGARYAFDFAFPHPSAREAAYFDDSEGGKLVGLGLHDETPQALSAVFFFFDPAYDSLGTANVMDLISDARALGKKWLYLGYHVEGCASLRYKATFRPHERLLDRPSDDEPPRWTKA